MQQSIWQGIKLVFRKELVVGLRFKAAWAAMLMFALTTLACVSMAMQGGCWSHGCWQRFCGLSCFLPH